MFASGRRKFSLKPEEDEKAIFENREGDELSPGFPSSEDEGSVEDTARPATDLEDRKDTDSGIVWKHSASGVPLPIFKSFILNKREESGLVEHKSSADQLPNLRKNFLNILYGEDLDGRVDTRHRYSRLSQDIGLKREKPGQSLYYFSISNSRIPRLNHLSWSLLVVLLLSVLCLSFTASLWCTDIFWSSIRRMKVMQNKSLSYDFFEQLPVADMQLCFHIYNYTNVDQYYSSGEDEEDQLAVQILGPFCFKEIPMKANLRFSDDNNILTYVESSKFYFDASRSNGSLQDIFVVPNFPYLVSTAMAADYNAFLRLALSSHIRSEKFEPFVRLSVAEFLLGYDDPLMDWLVSMASVLRINVPFERFGMLRALMDFLNVEYSVNTGLSDSSKTGHVTAFKGASKISMWKTDACNGYQGGEGTFWNVSQIRNHENMTFFASILCRNVMLHNIGDFEFVWGVKVPRFELTPDMFTKGRPGYECYCDENCETNFLDIRQCIDGFPLRVTYPKFYGLNPTLLSHLKNLPTPDPNTWSTFFDVHPMIGITLKFTQRLQFNLEIRKAQFMSLPEKIEDGRVLPTVIIERSILRLRPDAELLLYYSLTLLPILEKLLKYGGILASFFFLYKTHRTTKKLQTASSKKELNNT